jgi:hypothetical protein
MQVLKNSLLGEVTSNASTLPLAWIASLRLDLDRTVGETASNGNPKRRETGVLTACNKRAEYEAVAGRARKRWC